MKIMYTVSNLEKSGPINVLYNIIQEVCRIHECIIVTLSPENEDSMIDEFKKLDINIISLNFNRKNTKNVYLIELRKVIEKIKPDIIHTHGFRSDRYINILNKGKEFIHTSTLHNYPFDDYPKYYGVVPGTLLAINHMLVIRRIKNKVACSYSIAKKYKSANINGVSVIQNGVNTDIYKIVDLNEKKELRKILGLPIDKKIIVSTGALIKRKRPLKLCEIFSEFDAEENFLFLVLGDGKLASKLEKYRNANIRFLGPVQNVGDYLKSADLFISNSKAEGLPMAMLEAAATGLVIVGSNISPHKEVKSIYDDKTFLYDGQKNEDIKKSIREAIVKSDHYVGGATRKFKLSSHRMSNEYLEYYSKFKVK
ncbi:glycosyltransferase family 4 protein [Planococcus halocryophilus]|uniref:glycosyltransferase family 4 protein n=1 Tax=Planococcus halocryophilus TaxID=1215089 RepID=UPI001F0F5EE9|nr:glycosyltransferase family 4 protein [Planococcus halocryophilus]MCH4826789.1 glycosyltransferase family 4 protein [Planococcus halocryophilus]